MAAPDQQRGQSVKPNLLWVSDQDGASKAKTRSHAMKEWRRLRKGSRATFLKGATVDPARFSWVKSVGKELSSSPSSSEGRSPTNEEDDYLRRQLLPLAHKLRSQSPPQAVLNGVGRRNPFLPMDLGQDGDLLLDRCMFAMNPLMSGFGMEAKFNPLKDLIWRTIIEDSTGTALQGAIALSSCQTDMLAGRRLGHETISQLLTAMRAVSDNLTSISDSLIFAVSFLASFELWAGNHKSRMRHLDGMTRIVDRRGGFIELGPEIQMVLLWTFLVTPDRLMPYSPTTPGTSPHEPEKSSTQLFAFFNTIQTLSKKSNSPYSAVKFAFSPRSALFTLLSTSKTPNKISPPQSVSRVSLVRLAAVIYIHLTLLEMPGDVYSWIEYCTDIERRLIDHEADIENKGSTMMSYIWLLVKAEDRVALENPFRAWLTARMLKDIMTVLKPTSLEHITDLLLSYLMGHTYSDSELVFLLGLSQVTEVMSSLDI